MSIKHAVSWARDTVHDLWFLNHPLKPSPKATEVSRWCPPDTGWVKVNSDAAFQVQGKVGATAYVIRDHRGRFRGVKADWYERCLDACMMETLACCDGLRLARQHGGRRKIHNGLSSIQS